MRKVPKSQIPFATVLVRGLHYVNDYFCWFEGLVFPVGLVNAYSRLM